MSVDFLRLIVTIIGGPLVYRHYPGLIVTIIGEALIYRHYLGYNAACL
ncbi:hypothetical protein [Neobacillus sp. DY30]|nr:hypothetical protein [Neobacillus sp. DY30]WHY01437.1 hypothetical protein QNH29_04075 [Neobacillus sp. DY30]